VIASSRSAAADVRERVLRFEGGGMRTFVEEEPLVWHRTQGATVWDEDGREYLDLYAGFAAANIGYCHPRVTEAIRRQAGLMTHCPSSHPSRVRAELYERLSSIAPAGLDRFLLAITGSQANELAIQLARAFTDRRAIVSFSGAYLGRSAGTVPYAGKLAYRASLRLESDAVFLPFPDPFRSPWADGEAPDRVVLGLLEHMLSDPASGIDPVAAVVVEPIQGNGGVVIPPPSFLPGLRELCDRFGCLLIFDEIQCGFGRTGRMWASDHWDVRPDLMTAGKGLGGGMPLAAVLGRPDVMSTWAPDTVTSTFLTNAVNEASGIAAIEVLVEEGLVQRSARLGQELLARLRDGLAHAPEVGEVRGLGLFLGIELTSGCSSKTPDAGAAERVQRALRKRGILVGRGGRYGNVIKLSPPLVIEEEALLRAADALIEVLCP
jgi:4-aminobutyrate aminotransferase